MQTERNERFKFSTFKFNRKHCISMRLISTAICLSVNRFEKYRKKRTKINRMWHSFFRYDGFEDTLQSLISPVRLSVASYFKHRIAFDCTYTHTIEMFRKYPHSTRCKSRMMSLYIHCDGTRLPLNSVHDKCVSVGQTAVKTKVLTGGSNSKFNIGWNVISQRVYTSNFIVSTFSTTI